MQSRSPERGARETPSIHRGLATAATRKVRHQRWWRTARQLVAISRFADAHRPFAPVRADAFVGHNEGFFPFPTATTMAQSRGTSRGKKHREGHCDGRQDSPHGHYV
jgi:hypothetical protein